MSKDYLNLWSCSVTTYLPSTCLHAITQGSINSRCQHIAPLRLPLHVIESQHARSSQSVRSNGLDWLQAEPMTCSILLKTSTSTFTIPIKRVFPTSFAQFAIRQVAFDPLEFDTSPMNLQVFCSKDMRAYTMDAIRRTTHESTSPTNRIDSIWIG